MKIKALLLSFLFLVQSLFSSNPEEVFTQIYDTHYWGENGSGPGSTLEQTLSFRRFLQNFLRDHNIQSVVDVGCGVWDFQRAIDWRGIDYKGYDIVNPIIDLNNELFSTPSLQFFHSNGIDDDLPSADLLICKDVLQHLPNEDIARFLSQLGKFRYCLITNDVDPNSLSSSNSKINQGGYHTIDLTKPPFNVPGKKVLNYRTGPSIKQTLLIQEYQKEILSYDLTLIGPISFQSLCKYTPLWIDYLGNDLTINTIPLEVCNLSEVSPKVREVVNEGYAAPGNVALLLSHICSNANEDFYKNVPTEIPIKISYSSYDASRIPTKWTDIINTYFDAVTVLDPWCKNVYEKSGVIKPIFVLPHGLNLTSYLDQPEKTKPHTPFTFGVSGAFWDRKNHNRLLEAFINEFGNSPDVQLKIHGRGGELGIIWELEEMIRINELPNVEIICAQLNKKDYFNFMKSLDCYVLVSKAECYSISPREAMALGIPCILSNNTAHKTLCSSGLVEVVESSIAQPVMFAGVEQTGFDYDCKTRDLQRAMRKVYNDYASALEKAKKSREWVKQYTFDALKPLHLALVKPQEIILGDENKLTPYTLTTNSEELYEKYLQFIDQ